MNKRIGVMWWLLLFASIIAYGQEDKLPALLKERKRSGKVMFNKEQAMEAINHQRISHSEAIWQRWGEKPSPMFAYKDLDGKKWTNELVRGKVTVINFWHINSGPCLREAPWLNRLQEKHEDVNFLACTFNEVSQIIGAIEKTPFLLPQLTDAISLWHAFGVVISPTTIILDKEGKVFGVVTGVNDSLKRMVELKLKAAKKSSY